MESEVIKHGPLFDGSAPHIVADGIKAAEQAVAERIETAVIERLGHSIRHSTGKLIKSVQVTESEGGFTVDDGGIIYGPWIEGTSSRNHTTKFKGYSAFRKTRQQFEDSAGGIAQEAFNPAIGRLNE